jgi:hypothetical protein
MKSPKKFMSACLFSLTDRNFTSDADVIVLCIYFDKQMTNTSELWVQMGNVSSVKDGRRVLPGAHALSRCNTTSSFFGNGKRLVYKILKDAASDFLITKHEIATSLSGSPKWSKSWKSDAASFSILYTNLLPFPKKEEVVLHPERACNVIQISRGTNGLL